MAVASNMQSNRPLGRSADAPACRVPFPVFRDIHTRLKHKLGKKANAGPIMTQLMRSANKIALSEQVSETHKALDFYSRKAISIRRDTACLIALIGTMNIAETDDTGDFYRSYVNLTEMDRLTGLESLSRGSAFLKLFKIAGLLKVNYKQSKQSPSLSYCEIFVHHCVFKLAGISETDHQKEIKRKQAQVARKNKHSPRTQQLEAEKAKARVADFRERKIRKNSYRQRRKELRQSSTIHTSPDPSAEPPD